MIQSFYAVIINWNLKEDTLACVDSLLNAGARTDQIIVVDNASTDGSAQAVRERFGPAMPILVSHENLGFAGGCNLGILFALERNAQWILLLNNDTYVDVTFLREFEQAIRGDDGAAILGPVIYFHVAPNRVWYFGDRLIPGLLATRSRYRGKSIAAQLPPTMPVDFVSGCCMFVRRDVFDTVGLFDPRFFMYGEDVDFCWRARLAGFHLVVATRAKMWHRVSVSANRDKPTSRYLRVRNQNWFYRKYARGLQAPAMFAFALGRTICVALGDLAQGRLSLIAPSFHGLVDGWLKKPEDQVD